MTLRPAPAPTHGDLPSPRTGPAGGGEGGRASAVHAPATRLQGKFSVRRRDARRTLSRVAAENALDRETEAETPDSRLTNNAQASWAQGGNGPEEKRRGADGRESTNWPQRNTRLDAHKEARKAWHSSSCCRV